MTGATVGAKCAGHDTSIFLLREGERPFAIDRERITRFRHDIGFPYEPLEMAKGPVAGRSGLLEKVMKKGRSVHGNFLLIATAAVIILYVTFFLSNALSPDETMNLLLGRKILQGEYHIDFFHRMPLLPFLIASMYLVGLGVDAVRFVIPLVFILLSVAATYLLTREVAGEKAARISATLLLLFPMFWRWGTFVLSDIPLMALATFALYFFVRGLKDGRYFYLFGVSLGLASVTKLSFTILPFSIFLYLLLWRRKILRAKEFWAGIAIALAIFSAFFLTVYSMSGSVSLSEFAGVAEKLTGEKQSALTGSPSIAYFAKLVLFPLLIFLPFAYFRKFKLKRFLAAYSVLFLVIFSVLWVIRLRYFSPIYPIIMLFVAEGYLFLRERWKGRSIYVGAAFLLLALASLFGTFLLISLDSEMLYGADPLADYTKGLDGLIASDYLPDYLNMTNDMLMGKLAVRGFFNNFSDSQAESYGIRYIVLSIYGEWDREPDDTAYFHPKLGPLEIPFVKRPYSNGRVPPDYTFRTELYNKLEAGPKYSVVKQIYSNEGQRIFIIYEISE